MVATTNACAGARSAHLVVPRLGGAATASGSASAEDSSGAPGDSGFGASVDAPTTTVPAHPPTPSTAASCRAPTGLVDRLSELLMVGVDPTSPAAALDLVTANPYLGGIFIGGTGDALFTDSALQAALRAGAWFVAVDDEGGRVQRIDGLADTIPSARHQAQALSLQAIADVAARRGAALRAHGVNVDFAPVVDLTDGAGVIGDRAYSADPGAAVRNAGAFAIGLRSAAVVPTLKHFPGHGGADGDSHETAVSTPPLDALRGRDLVPYRSLIAPGPVAVMVGHLDVPGLTEAGLPASLSPAAYGLLRGEVGFDGVVFTDDLAGMKAVTSRFPTPEAVVRAIVAGADVALVGQGQLGPLLSALQRAADSGRLPPARIDDAVRRVRALKQAVGICAVM
jgi:beta-N-acetylhexosaminidase